MKWKRMTGLVATVSCVALVAAACGGGSGGDSELDDQRLVFVNFGGEALEAAERGWLEPFTEETGVQFALDSPTDSAKIKAMVESGNTTWDVVHNDIASGGSQCGTLYEERPADFDLSEVAEEYVTDDCGVPILRQAVALVYNKEVFGDDAPTSATDFLDTERFPGKRLIFNYPVGSVEPLLMADGAAPDDVFPVDWDRVTGIIERLGDDFEPVDSLAQIGEAVAAGDYAMCMCYVGRLANASEETRSNLGIVWDKTYLAWDAAYAVKGSQYPEAQMEFLQFLATSEGQKGFSEYLAYSPTTTGGLESDDVSDTFTDYLPDFNEDRIDETYVIDPAYWTANIDEAMERWTAAVAG